jgi:hypothetical protein
MHIQMIIRPDRMGANFTWYIMQMIYAHFHNYYIVCDGLKYEDSAFVQSVKRWIEQYNFKFEQEYGKYIVEENQLKRWIEDSHQDWPGNNMIVCKAIGCDLITYFKRHLYSEFRPMMEQTIQEIGYPVLENAENTICIHLRLDDVTHRFDYDGSICSAYYADKLNRGSISININEEIIWGMQHGVCIEGDTRHYSAYDCQAPISKEKLRPIIEEVRKKYPDHRILVVSSPNSTAYMIDMLSTTEADMNIDNPINIEYTTLSSDDPSVDLWTLCQADVLICSRSLFCLSAVYCGKAKEVYLPMWGHIAGTGLTSNYDNNTNFHYFY